MKQNELITTRSQMQTFAQLSEMINKNPHMLWLKPHLKPCQQAITLTTQLPILKNRKMDTNSNSITNLNGFDYPLNTEMCNRLFLIPLKQCTDTVNAISNETRETLKSIYKNMYVENLAEDFKKTGRKETIAVIHHILNYTRSEKYKTPSEDIFCNAMLLYFSKLVLYKSKKHDEDNTTSEIPLTNLCTEIAQMLVHLYMTANDSFKRLLDTLTDKEHTYYLSKRAEKYNQGITAKEEKLTLENFIEAIFETDSNHLEYCKTFYNIELEIKTENYSTTVINIMNFTLATLIVNKIKEGNFNWSELITNLEKKNGLYYLVSHCEIKRLKITTELYYFGHAVVDQLLYYNLVTKIKNTENSNVKKRSTHLIDLTKLITELANFTGASYIPMLSDKTSIKYLEKLEKSLQIQEGKKSTTKEKKAFLNLYRQNIESYIGELRTLTHNNHKSYATIDPTQINKNSYKTAYTIDKDALIDFIHLLNTYVGKKIDKVSKEDSIRYYRFLQYLYKIDFQAISQMELTLEDLNTFHLIVNFALDFDTEYHDKNIKSGINDASFNKRRIFKNIYNKIRHLKLFIKSFLGRALYFSLFSFFLVDSFLDSRGRVYASGYLLTPQTHTFTKPFIKLYINQKDTQDKLRQNFDRIIIQLQQRYSIPRELEFCHSYKKFMAASTENRIQQIHNFLDDTTVPLVEFKAYISSEGRKTFDQTREFLETKNFKTKKIGDELRVISYLTHEANRKYSPASNSENLLGYDARSSGLQIQSIFLKDKALAKIASLTGTQHFDLYTSSYETFQEQLVKIGFASCDSICNILNIKQSSRRIDYNYEVHNTKLNANVDDLLQTFLNLSSRSNDTTSLLEILVHKLENSNNNILKELQNFTPLKWSLTIGIKQNLTDLINGPFFGTSLKAKEILIALHIFRIIIRCKWAFDKIPGLLEKIFIRNLFKHAAMALGYGATDRSIILNLKKTLSQIILEKNLKYNKSALDVISRLASRFFSENIIQKYLFSSTTYKQIAKTLAKEGQIITIKSPKGDLACTMTPTKTETRAINKYSPTGKRLHRSNLRGPHPSGKIDKRKLAQLFAPNLAHFTDSLLVRLYRDECKTLNQLLGLDLQVFTNHDHFMMTFLDLIQKNVLLKLTRDLYDQDLTDFISYGYDKKPAKVLLDTFITPKDSPNYLRREDINNPNAYKA